MAVVYQQFGYNDLSALDLPCTRDNTYMDIAPMKKAIKDANVYGSEKYEPGKSNRSATIFSTSL